MGGVGEAEGTWVWSAIEVTSRVCLASMVSRRTLRATRRFLADVYDSCGRMILPTVFTTDEFKYYAPVIDKVFGPLAAQHPANARVRAMTLRSNLDPGRLAALTQRFLAIYSEALAVNTVLFDGVPELLEAIEVSLDEWLRRLFPDQLDRTASMVAVVTSQLFSFFIERLFRPQWTTSDVAVRAAQIAALVFPDDVDSEGGPTTPS